MAALETVPKTQEPSGQGTSVPGFPLPHAPRMGLLPPYLLARFNKLNDELRAKGVDVIDFGMGNPIEPVMPAVIEELKASLGAVQNHRYTNPRGLLPLKQAFARHYERQFGVLLDPDSETIMTIGSKDALSHLCLSIIGPGDLCVVPTPAYMIHRYAPILAGGSTVGVRIQEEEPGEQLLRDIRRTFETIQPRPKLLLLNFPQNPTAKSVELAFFEEAVALARHFKFWVLNDFAYGHTCFDGYKAPSILQVKGAKEVAVETFTFSKPYNMAGWRVGFMAGNPHLVEILGRIKSYFDYGHFACIQLAAIKALDHGDEFILQQSRVYQRRRDVLLQEMARVDWGPTHKTRATMFTWQPLPKACKGLKSIDFALDCLEKTGVCFSPGGGFGEEGEGQLRIAFVESEERIRKAVQRVADYARNR